MRCFVYFVASLWLFDLSAVASALRTAFVKIDVCERTRQSSSVDTPNSSKLQGTFTNIGSLSEAQGDVWQIHPLGLCNISNGDAPYDDEWVCVVKLTLPSRESGACNGTIQKALGAVKKGAKAVIFDITDSPGAADELNAKHSLIPCPVIIISGRPAQKLMRIVSRQKVLKARITLPPDVAQTKETAGEYVDMLIFMTCFVLITVTCFILLLKIKWKQTKKESSLAKMAFDAVSRMESKKYEESSGVETVKTIKERQWERKLSNYSGSVVGISCVICLEGFKEGQEIRVVSCGHEFHLKCVDPWLLTNYTCPLCMLNIVEREGNGIKTESRCSPSFRSLFRCCFSSSQLSSSSMVYSITHEDVPNDLSPDSNDGVESLNFSPLSINSSQTLWTEHLPVASNEYFPGNEGGYPHLSPGATHSLPCLARNGEDIASLSSLSADKLQQVHEAAGRGNTQDGVRRPGQENRPKTIQISDLGIRKYAELGDAV